MKDSLGANCYWEYLKSACIELDSDTLSRVGKSLEETFWDNPTSALEFNNVAVVALVEAEECHDSSLRGIYLEIAFEALNKGMELYNDPLTVAHLALVFAMIGEREQAMQTAFPTLLNTLQPAYVNDKPIPAGLVYLPPSKGFTDSRSKNLAKILEAENSYAQSILLLSEVLCQTQLVFYSETGLRSLHLAVQLFPDSTYTNLKLGIASIINNQLEGLLYLHRARQMAPNCASILHTLYLAYRDLGQVEVANSWLDMGCNNSCKNQHSLDWRWAELGANSTITYVKFENHLILAVEPSLRSIVTRMLIAEGDWFENEMELWRSWLKPGMTVIDVGANVGVYTFSAAQKVGAEGCVLAVEPFSNCVRCLQETCNINQLSWVKVCAGAASDRNGTARLALHTASELNELVDSDTEGAIPLSTFEEVTCFTLDSLIEPENLSQIDFLKIDAEGHEIKVLEGSNRILTEFAPTILYENIAGSRGSNLVVADFLNARGYQLFRYQPYLQQLIRINSTEDLQGRLNLIAMPLNKASASIS